MDDYRIPVNSKADSAHTSMTLRDYYAAAALAGVLARGVGLGVTNCDVCDRAFEVADAMLEAREAE